jgi:DNA polymerase (family 10)
VLREIGAGSRRWTVVDNAAVAGVFREIADLLEAKKENYFKIRAYRQVADTIDGLPDSVEEIAARGALRDLPGVGEAITGKITELLMTGELQFLKRLRAEAGDGIGSGETGGGV